MFFSILLMMAVNEVGDAKHTQIFAEWIGNFSFQLPITFFLYGQISFTIGTIMWCFMLYPGDTFWLYMLIVTGLTLVSSNLWVPTLRRARAADH